MILSGRVKWLRSRWTFQHFFSNLKTKHFKEAFTVQTHCHLANLGPNMAISATISEFHYIIFIAIKKITITIIFFVISIESWKGILHQNIYPNTIPETFFQIFVRNNWYLWAYVMEVSRNTKAETSKTMQSDHDHRG